MSITTMSISKTIGTLVATVLIGFVTFLMGTPKNILKSKVKTTKTSTESGMEEKENLFI